MNYIGIDLGGTNIKGALVSAEGEILKEHSIPTRVDLGPEAVAGRIGQVIAQLSIGEDTVGGVGVGCPGTVDDASGIVRFAANLNFVNFDLRSALRAHTALPIHLGNDANAAALGEALFGCGRGAESTIVATLGTAYSLGDIDPEDPTPLAQQIRNDGRWTPATALALLVFVLLYAPCLVTVAAIRQETGSGGWPVFSMVFNTLIAFGAAVAVRHVTMLFL